MNTEPSSLKLNQKDARWLGVCAGIAEWLDIPAVLVRIIFVICVVSWPPLIVGYFLLYFCLDKDITPDKMRNYFKSATTAEHFRALDYRKPIYRNERNTRIAGVCSGIADYFEVSAFAVRAVTLFSLFLFGPFTFWAYIICMFVFEPDPHVTPGSRSEKRARRRQRRHEKRARRKMGKSYANEDYRQFAEDSADETCAEARAAFHESTGEPEAEINQKGSSPHYSRDQCTKIYNSLELRLREIEAYMTSRKFRLHCEINRI